MLPDLDQNRQSNFYYSFLILPKPKREAIETIYAFCRYTDDIVDEAASRKEQYARLRQWTKELHLSLSGASHYAVLNKLSTIIQQFNIPLKHFYDLIKGMEMDLTKKRYRTFAELQEYCYHAASTVGLICAEVFGYKNEDAKQYAMNLGIALQLTNILRDIRQDAKRGRIYLPLEDLRRFQYSEEELLQGVYNDRFVELMKFECERAHAFFRRAKAFLAEEDKPLFTAARTMGNIYYLLLRRIEKANYDVFSRRIRLSPPLKLLIAMVLSLRSKAPKNLHRYIRAELPA
ncbi:MAG: presqualene diphosphate synthase HpnD [Ignavibacteriales bacterium]|nr:presqualene diphosphate synthase HpnD [Ignavibacteriales bacterium]